MLFPGAMNRLWLGSCCHSPIPHAGWMSAPFRVYTPASLLLCLMLVASSLCPSSLSTVTAPDSSTHSPLLTLTMSSYTAQCRPLPATTLSKNYVDSFLRGGNLASNSVTSTLSLIKLEFTAHSVQARN